MKATWRNRWRIRLVIVLLLAVALPLGAVWLRNVPPGEGTIFPRCVFQALTGWHCPGCGLTRCVHALLNGQVRQAFAYHPLFVLFLPLIGFWMGNLLVAGWTGRPASNRRWPAWLIHAFVGLLLVFGFLRNLESYPFHLLAPHEISADGPRKISDF